MIPQWDEYKDWAAYRSSADMLKQGISLLNSFYHDWIQKKYSSDNWLTSKEIELVLKVIECLGGVLGFWPTMEAYVTEEMRNNIHPRLLDEYEKVEAYKDQHGRIRSQSLPPRKEKIPTTLFPELIPVFREFATSYGVSTSELDKAIQWRIKPFSQVEREFLIEMVRCNTHPTENKLPEEAIKKYYLSLPLPIDFKLFAENKLSKEATKKHYQSTPFGLKRFIWQMIELNVFIISVVRACSFVLASYPVKIPSGRYEEKLQPERTQADLIKEMEQELSSLPRFVAWTKTLDEDGRVRKTKVKTIYVGNKRKRNDSFDETMWIILNHTHRYFCTPRDQIEKEIAERYAKWRKAAGKLPPTWTPA